MTALPELATAFDAIDRSEITRRLHTGEAFDHTCNQTLANIESIAGQLKTQLGERAQEFEGKIDALITADHKTPATQALVDMGLLRTCSTDCVVPNDPSCLGAGISWPTGPIPSIGFTDELPEQPTASIEQVAPASSAAVIIAMLQDLAEDSDGTIPVRVVVAGKKLAVSRAEFMGGEILLKCE